MLSLLKQINAFKDLSNFNSRGLHTEEKAKSKSKHKGKVAGRLRRERRPGITHTLELTHTHTPHVHAGNIPSSIPPHCHCSVKLVSTIVPGCTLQLTSRPGFSIAWRLRGSLAEKDSLLYLLATLIYQPEVASCRLLHWALVPFCSTQLGSFGFASGCISA